METDVENKSWQFKPGNSGRPKGARNKLTAERQEKMEFALSLLEPQMEEFFNKLKPVEKARIWLDIHEFLLPKLNRTTLETDSEEEITKIVFEVRRTPEDFRE
ncbi:MAG: hypothetical protein IH597_01735 [Bacteroidales bacterium]|nr:hypothetical protein [Bacteroidales bacterium]